MSSLLEGIAETIVIRGRAANAAEQIRKRSCSSNYNNSGSTTSSTSLCTIGPTSSPPSRMTFSAAACSPSKCKYTLSRRTFHTDPAPSPFPPRANSSFLGSACASNNYESPYHLQGRVHRNSLPVKGGASASASSSPKGRVTSLKETDDTNPARFFVSRPSLSLGQVELVSSPFISKVTSTSDLATAAEQPSTTWDSTLRSPYTLRQPKAIKTTTTTTAYDDGVGIAAGQRPPKTRPPPLSPTVVVGATECTASVATSENANIQKESQILSNKNQSPQAVDVDVDDIVSTQEEKKKDEEKEDLVSAELLSWRGQLLRSLQRISKIKADVALRLTYGKALLAYVYDSAVSDSPCSSASRTRSPSQSHPSQKEEMGLFEERSRRLRALLELCETALTEHSHNMLMMNEPSKFGSLRKREADAVRSAMMTLAEEVPTLLLYTNIANDGKVASASDIVAKCAPTTPEKSSPGTARSHHHYMHTLGLVADGDKDRDDVYIALSTRRELTSRLPREEEEKQEVEGSIKEEKASLSREDLIVDEDARDGNHNPSSPPPPPPPPPPQEDESTKPPDGLEEAPRKRIGRVCPGRRRRLNLMTDEEMEAEAKAEAEAMI